jgi:hypothetical protein
VRIGRGFVFVIRGGRERRGPGIEGERQDPGEIVDERRPVDAARDLDVAERQHRQGDERAERNAAVGGAPRRVPGEQRRDDHACRDQRLLKLRNQEQRAGALTGRFCIGDKVRVQEAGDDREARDVDGRGRGERLARASMRLREQRKERRDTSE